MSVSRMEVELSTLKLSHSKSSPEFTSSIPSNPKSEEWADICVKRANEIKTWYNETHITFFHAMRGTHSPVFDLIQEFCKHEVVSSKHYHMKMSENFQPLRIVGCYY
jgi:hypothetical protein